MARRWKGNRTGNVAFRMGGFRRHLTTQPGTRGTIRMHF
jgi:hypothetical protein